MSFIDKVTIVATAGKGGDGKFRLLVVANETVGGEALIEEIRRRCQDRRCEILVVTPALAASRASHWASDIDEAIELARQRMELSLIGQNLNGGHAEYGPLATRSEIPRALAVRLVWQQ